MTLVCLLAHWPALCPEPYRFDVAHPLLGGGPGYSSSLLCSARHSFRSLSQIWLCSAEKRDNSPQTPLFSVCRTCVTSDLVLRYALVGIAAAAEPVAKPWALK